MRKCTSNKNVQMNKSCVKICINKKFEKSQKEEKCKKMHV